VIRSNQLVRFSVRSLWSAAWLTVMVGAAPAVARAQSPEPNPPASEQPQPAAPAAPPGGKGSFLSSITVFGLGDAYVMANANQPPEGDNLLRNFDTHSGELRMNYAEVAFERKTSAQAVVGFRADFGAGPTANMVGSPEPGPDGLQYIQQGYLSVRAPLGSGLTIDAGKFVTPAGAEVIETQDNWNYSRSLLFSWAIPYYHAGVRASYALSDKVTATGFLLNGWNNVKDNNGSKSFGTQVLVTASDRVSIAGTWIGGAEQADVEGWRNMLDAIVNVTVTPRVKLQLNADYVRDRALGPGVGWHGVAAALRTELTPKWTLAPRVEWFSDPQGASTGTAQDVVEGTITVQRAIVAGLSARVEYRVDHSNTDFFPTDDGPAGRWQQTFGVGLFYGWASR
jgi:hypothetical protein